MVMQKKNTFRAALVASLIALAPLAAMAQQPGQPATDLDAGPPPEAAPDPLAPADANDPPPPAPGALEPAAAEAPPPPPEPDPLAAQIRTLAATPAAASRGDHRDDVAGMSAFYSGRDGLPVWTDKDGLNPRAAQAAAEIRKANDWGLDAAAFVLPQPADTSPAALADAEIKFSLAVLKYARHARGGRIDYSGATELIDAKPQIYDPKSVLQAIAAAEPADAYLRGLHPKHEQFQRLRLALLAADKASAAPPQVRIPPGPDIRPGDWNEQVPLVRQRLNIAAGAADPSVYDAPLISAVRWYQREQGWEPDGLIDGKLRAALNNSAGGPRGGERQRIVANMERWRLLPDGLGDFYVWNSIPEQITRVFDHGKLVLMERIVVGKPNTPTPSFSAQMQFVIFHPEWGVPDSIKLNELAPKLRRASGYSSGYSAYDDDGFFGYGRRSDGGSSQDVLDRMGLRVSLNGQEVDPGSVDWSSVDIRRFQFIQASGGRNVLGLVKFRFPNKHDVYMHDTPEQKLFNEKQRTFSHGCMRTQNPLRLAEVILAHDAGRTPEYIQDLVAQSGQPNEIKLNKPVPVHVTYFTVDVDQDGKLRTHPDIYGIDDKITAALKGKPLQFSLKSSAEARNEPAAQAPRAARQRPRATRSLWDDEW